MQRKKDAQIIMYGDEALDLVINSIKTRFDQPGYVMYKNLETLLVSAANGKELKSISRLIRNCMAPTLFH